MKKVFIALLLLSIGHIAFSQSTQVATDYYFPESGTKVSFIDYKIKDTSRVIFYAKTGTDYEILDCRFFANKLSVKCTNKLKVSSNQVYLLSSEMKSALAPNADYNYLTNIVFKVPIQNQEVSWTFKEQDESIECTSSWATLILKGKPHKVIKLKKRIIGNTFIKATVEYYAKGIGLVETDILDNNNKLSILEELAGMSLDKSIEKTISEKEKIAEIRKTLHISNINTIPIVIKDSAEKETTIENATYLKINFTIDANPNAVTGINILYLNIYDSQSNLLYKKGTFLTNEEGGTGFTERIEVNYLKGEILNTNYKVKLKSALQSDIYKICFYNNGFKIGQATVKL